MRKINLNPNQPIWCTVFVAVFKPHRNARHRESVWSHWNIGTYCRFCIDFDFSFFLNFKNMFYVDLLYFIYTKILQKSSLVDKQFSLYCFYRRRENNKDWIIIKKTDPNTWRPPDWHRGRKRFSSRTKACEWFFSRFLINFYHELQI